ncbi:MAG TPA: DUF397 domain-containing protein [Actinokineospora sp.]|nr:DUF397 domain-containing protein [Actinokineospora sp.]
MHAEWRKSTFSGGSDAECVEVAYAAEVRLRDSKNPDAGSLAIPTPSWHTLLRAVRP